MTMTSLYDAREKMTIGYIAILTMFVAMFLKVSRMVCLLLVRYARLICRFEDNMLRSLSIKTLMLVRKLINQNFDATT